MASKSVGVAYLPTSPVSTEQIKDFNAPQKIDIPSYSDVGVRYEGFSKQLYSGNNFKLNPQEKVDANFAGTYGGGETSSTLALTVPLGKTFYMTKMVLHFYKINGITLGAQTVTVASATTRIILKIFENQMNQAATNWEFLHDFDFSVPIKVESNQIILSYSQARAAGDAFCANIYGWYE